MTIPAIEPVAIGDFVPQTASPPADPQRTDFLSVLMNGVSQANGQIADAEALATAFTLDKSIPVHQVTYALEQARLTTELVMQVRARLLEGYQELMRTQL